MKTITFLREQLMILCRSYLPNCEFIYDLEYYRDQKLTCKFNNDLIIFVFESDIVQYYYRYELDTRYFGPMLRIKPENICNSLRLQNTRIEYNPRF